MGPSWARCYREATNGIFLCLLRTDRARHNTYHGENNLRHRRHTRDAMRRSKHEAYHMTAPKDGGQSALPDPSIALAQTAQEAFGPNHGARIMTIEPHPTNPQVPMASAPSARAACRILASSSQALARALPRCLRA